jgi:hypothetical protein
MRHYDGLFHLQKVLLVLIRTRRCCTRRRKLRTEYDCIANIEGDRGRERGKEGTETREKMRQDKTKKSREVTKKCKEKKEIRKRIRRKSGGMKEKKWKEEKAKNGDG